MAFRKKRKDPFKEIQACLQKRDYKGALDWFNTLLQKDTKNTQIRLRFADTLVLAGNKNEAVKQFRVVADELAEKGFMIRAIAINKKILQLDPRQTDVHQKLAEMNEGRSASASSRQSLAEALTSPDAPLRRSTEAPPPPEPPPSEAETQPEVREVPETQSVPPPAPLSELSLEESMAMEFGAASEAAPEAEPILAPPEPEMADADAAVSGGFELVEQEQEQEQEPVSDEPPSFDEEPIEILDVESVSEPELEIEVEGAVELSLSGVEEPPSEMAGSLELTEPVEPVEPAEPDDVVVEADPLPEVATVTPGEEMEVVELEVEAEPAMATAEVESLVGALGEDIDSLIDSIIDDVGSSAKGEQATQDEPPTHIPLFSDLTTAEFIDVAILLVRRVVKLGEVVVREGDPGDSMFIISTGEVRATISRDGQQAPVATLRDGDFFGEMAVLSGEPRTATVTAVKNTEVLELSRENLQEICRRHPHVEAKIRLAYDERVSIDRAR